MKKMKDIQTRFLPNILLFLATIILVFLATACTKQIPVQSITSQPPQSPTTDSLCGNGIRDADETSETCCKDVPCPAGFECNEQSEADVTRYSCRANAVGPLQENMSQNVSTVPSGEENESKSSGRNESHTTTAANKTEKPVTPSATGLQAGPVLNDVIYEYNARRYYYNETAFGVADDYTYDGPALHMALEKSFTMRLFNIVPTPEKRFDLEVNYESDKYELAVGLRAGDVYITRDGIKFTINEIGVNRINFTMEKVPKEQHTIVCPDCILSLGVLREDDGIRFINLHQKLIYTMKGNEYKFGILNFHRETNEAMLQVNSEDLPLLERNQVYTLRDGIAIKYLFASRHDFAGSDEWGYAFFGFVNATDLPDRVICPECTDFIYLVDEHPQKFRYKNMEHTFETRRRDGGVFLRYDDGDFVKLELNKSAMITNEIHAKLLFTKPQNRIGLVMEGHDSTRTTCKPMKDMNLRNKGIVYLSTGAQISDFEREDVCLDDNTLIEYFCRPVEGRAQKSSGEGWTGAMTYASCPCKDGVCTGEPVCVGADCV
ncbi:hypothetical protein HZB03_01705 [Candidatus Woesearchaeota archaeon]|nr:hypothetical protein [Candidatus Woesearchaeota archaeon]